MNVALAHSDEREVAFDALLPLSQAILDGLTQVEAVLDDERKLLAPLRRDWHPTQLAAARGSSRFANAMRELRQLEAQGLLRLISTPSQMAQNLWLWRIDERHVLRVKHDLEDIADPGTATLFSLEPSAGSSTVFLTWETAPDGSVRHVAFASLDEPKWTILLRELLDAIDGPTSRVAPARPQLNIRSKLVRDDADAQSSDG